MRVIMIKNNEPLLTCIKLFQTTIRFSYTHNLKKFIKNNHAMKLKYILWYQQFVRSIDWKTQIIEYALNRKNIYYTVISIVTIYTIYQKKYIR